MQVRNMVSSKGNKVVNQFIVDGEYKGQQGQYFQSYNSVIAFKPADGSTVTLDSRCWDYSTTTGKYRNIFLGEDKRATQKKIDSGAYILADLN